MITRISNWLHDRTQYRDLLAPLRGRTVPGGPSWAYTTATCLLWLLAIEVITGLLMMSSYSPSVGDAWASVHHIEQTPAGSFLRGLHFYCAQAMIVLFGAHTIRVLLAAAFRRPNELIWITGLILMPVMITWAITGNPLSGTQKGFSQIEVEGNIIASTPVVGPIIQRILIGGEEVGNLTLTHLYALHVGVFPLVGGLLLLVHISQVYRHGLSAKSDEEKQNAVPYWPYQTSRNMAVIAVVFGGLAFAAWQYGAPLESPADPQLPHSPRPEWYFLFLFELRRHFVGSSEWIATILLPVASMLFLLAMPLIDRMFSRSLSAVARITLVSLGMAMWTGLTLAAVWRDRADQDHQHALVLADQFSHRARELADRNGVPESGAASLLRNDPQTQGPLLFQQHCLACHPYQGGAHSLTAEKPSAPNLFGFGKSLWNEAILDPARIGSDEFFGKTAKAEGDMVQAVRGKFDEATDDAAKAELTKKMKAAARALVEEATPTAKPDEATAQLIDQGRTAITQELGCTDCHKFRDAGELGTAPDLTGYGSREWLRGMIANPQHDRFYPGEKNDRMPAFAREPGSQQNLLTDSELNLIVEWLLGE